MDNEGSKTGYADSGVPAANKKLCIIAFAVIFIYLAFRERGQDLRIFQDEQQYLFGMRYDSYAESFPPSYLYYMVYGFLEPFDEWFLDAARVLNAIFLMLSGWLVHRIASQRSRRSLAAYIAAASIMLPTAVRADFILPESMYQAAFWGLMWILARRPYPRTAGFGALVGAYVGAMALIKVHALFLLPGFALFVFFTAFPKPGAAAAGVAAKMGLCSLAAFLATKLGLGWLYAGSAGLSVMGRQYGEYAGAGWSGIDIARYVGQFFFMLAGYIQSVWALFAVPVLLAVIGCRRHSGGGRGTGIDGEGGSDAALIAGLSFLASLVAMSAAFSALTGEMSQDYPQEMLRIQTRYFGFIFPIFLIAAGRTLDRIDAEAPPPRRIWEKMLYLPLSAVTLYAVLAGFMSYHLAAGPLDCPELWSVRDIQAMLTMAADWAVLHSDRLSWTAALWPSLFAAVGLIILAAPCLLWRFGEKKAAACFLFVLVPAIELHSLYYWQRFNAIPLVAWPEVHSADWVADFVGEELSDTVIVSDLPIVAGIMRHRFPNKKVRLLSYYGKGEFDMSLIDDGTKWVVAAARARIPANRKKMHIRLPTHVYPGHQPVELVRVSEFDYSVNLIRPEIRWPLKFVREGENEIVLRYSHPLPRKMRLSIDAPPEDRDRVVEYEIDLPGLERPLIIECARARRRELTIECPTLAQTLWIRRVNPAGPEEWVERRRPLRLNIVAVEEGNFPTDQIPPGFGGPAGHKWRESEN